MTNPQGPSTSTVNSLKSRHSPPLTPSRIKTVLDPSPTPGSEITKPLLLDPHTHSLSKTSASPSLFRRATPTPMDNKPPYSATLPLLSKTLMTNPQGPSTSMATPRKAAHSPLSSRTSVIQMAPWPLQPPSGSNISTISGLISMDKLPRIFRSLMINPSLIQTYALSSPPLML